MQFQLTPEQIGIIGLVAAILAQGAKIIFAWIGKPIDRKWVTAVLLVAGMGMAYIWARPALPTWPILIGEPIADMLAVLGFFMSLVLAASAVVGIATPIYNLLLEKVFERAGVGTTLVAQLTDRATENKIIPPDGGMS
jgi:hypothetical protein